MFFGGECHLAVSFVVPCTLFFPALWSSLLLTKHFRPSHTISPESQLSLAHNWLVSSHWSPFVTAESEKLCGDPADWPFSSSPLFSDWVFPVYAFSGSVFLSLPLFLFSECVSCFWFLSVSFELFLLSCSLALSEWVFLLSSMTSLSKLIFSLMLQFSIFSGSLALITLLTILLVIFLFFSCLLSCSWSLSLISDLSVSPLGLLSFHFSSLASQTKFGRLFNSAGDMGYCTGVKGASG